MKGGVWNYIVISQDPHKKHIIDRIYLYQSMHIYAPYIEDIEISQWAPTFGIKSIFNIIVHIMTQKTK